MSLLLDPKVPGKTASQQFHQLQLPFYLETIAAFKDSLKLSEEKLREIGFYARKQRDSI